MKKVYALLTVLVFALILTTPVFALQGETPEPQVAEVGLLDVALLMAATAFFKARFKWEDEKALGAAFVLGAFFAFGPQLSELFPPVAPWLLTFFDYVKLVIFATGSYSGLIDIGGKIGGKIAAKAKPA